MDLVVNLGETLLGDFIGRLYWDFIGGTLLGGVVNLGETLLGVLLIWVRLYWDFIGADFIGKRWETCCGCTK